MASRSQREQQEADRSPDRPHVKGGADTGEPQTEEWLAVAPGAQEVRQRSAQAGSPRREVDPPNSTPIERELSEIRARLAEVEATQIDHARLLREAVGQARQAEEPANRAGREGGLHPSPKAETNTRPPVPGSSINGVEWDELRALGLSVTDSARLLAIREMRGGFDSLEELDDLRDFPAETVELLKLHFGTENSG